MTAARRPPRADPRRHRPLHRPALLRGRRRNSTTTSSLPTRRTAAFSGRRRAPAISCSICRAISRDRLARLGLAAVERDAARHGGRGGAVLQLSPRLPARRIGLRPRSRGDRARALTARCPTSSCSVSSVCSAFSRPARCFDRALRPEPLAALALIALAALLASCQPLPHPFADDRPPAELLAVPESAGVSIAPIEGLPGAIAAKLGAATAHALLGHDIPASEKTTGHGTFQLYGQLIQSEQSGRSGVAVLWRLEDAKRRQIGEREVAIEGTAEDWQSPDSTMIERVAALTADAVAPLLLKESGTRKIRRPRRRRPPARRSRTYRRNRPRRNRPSRNPSLQKPRSRTSPRRSRQPRHHLRPRARRANRTADGSGWPCVV